MQGEVRDPFPPAISVDEEAGDTPIGQLAQSGFVTLPTTNVREFRGRAELTPSDGAGAVKNERGVRSPFPDPSLLQGTVLCGGMLPSSGVR